MNDGNYQYLDTAAQLVFLHQFPELDDGNLPAQNRVNAAVLNHFVLCLPTALNTAHHWPHNSIAHRIRDVPASLNESALYQYQHSA